MAARNPSDWMWAEACQLIEQAERMHRQFFRLIASEERHAVWEPPVDVFEDDREVVIVVALPGVSAEGIEVTYEPGALVVRAARPHPFVGARRALQLEIPYGLFERRIALPTAHLVGAARELRDGCLIVRLGKRGWTHLS